ncbi:MAG: phosphatidate cytidylyltransferase [Candidatus Neomarinimicrobiota bacterium]
MNNFATRMIINVFGIPGILLLIYFGGIPFLGLIVAIAVLSQVEFFHIARIKGSEPYAWFSIALGIIWLGVSYWLPQVLMFLFIVVAVSFVFYNLSKRIDGATINLSVSAMGFLYVPVLLSTLVLLRNLGNQFPTVSPIEARQLTMLLFASIWICDSLAFVFGKWIKGPKMAPLISPGKTVSGCVAGLIGAVVTTLLFRSFGWAPESLNLTSLVIFGILAGVFGQSGDFAESVFKRDGQIKDSGHLLLGHGGVLDRFDSFFVGAPVIYLYIVFLNSI